MDKEQLRKFVNKIFIKSGYPPVKNFAKEFSDGRKSYTISLTIFLKSHIVRFQDLFNAMYDEKIDCKLKPSALVEDRLLNWNRINCKSIPLKHIHLIFLKSHIVRFQDLFNAMYDEKIDCKLKPSALVEDRLLNWNRINCKSIPLKHINLIVRIIVATICFNYLQQRFYLVEPTMKSLAKGNNSDAVFKLIRVLINT